MEDFPIWLKLIIWGTIGLTVIYSIWGMLHSISPVLSPFGQEDSQRHAILLEPLYIHKNTITQVFLASQSR